MIVTRHEGALLVVMQPDHGSQTGLIAASWGNDEVHLPAQHQRESELAATHHDDGWAVWERHPDIDPASGHPVQFHSVRPLQHLAAYRAGIERAAQLDPWTGLLVSMHGAGLYNDRYGSYRLEELGEQKFSAFERVLVDEFLADMAALQDRLLGDVRGHRPIPQAAQQPEVMRAYLLLQAWDRLSLQFAYRHAADGAIRPTPSTVADTTTLVCANVGAFALELDPYPFDQDRVELPVRAYRVADRSYRQPEEFLAELAGAAAETIECVALRPRRRS